MRVERRFPRRASDADEGTLSASTSWILMWALLVGLAATAMSCGEEVGPEMQTLLSDPMASYDTADAELVKRSVFPPREISGKPADGFVTSRFVVGPGADPLAVRDAAVDAA